MSASSPECCVYLETSSVAELQRLDKIGPKKAADIVEYRQKEHGIKSFGELGQIKGFSHKTIEHLQSCGTPDANSPAARNSPRSQPACIVTQ